MGILTGTIFLFVVLFIIHKMITRTIFVREVRRLFSQYVNVSARIFHSDQLAGLPEPVQRYFRRVLKDGQPYISCARITHDGQFKTGLDKKWVNIRGEQYATTSNPGFIWKGTTLMFTARDMYIAGSGRLIVCLFSLLKVVDGKGNHYDQGELLRWLGESVLYPTNLLPGANVEWEPIDAKSATLIFNYAGFSLRYIVSVNDDGEITQLETKRYMDEGKLETWVIKLRNYRELNKIVIPVDLEVIWRLEKGDFSYARFRIKKVEYDIPEIFR